MTKTLSITRNFLLFTILFSAIGSSVTVYGQSTKTGQNSQQITQQKQKIEQLEKSIVQEEKAISKIKSGKAQSQERVTRLARQVDSRNRLIRTIESQASSLEAELRSISERSDSLGGELSEVRDNYAKMVRSAYRNYSQNNYLSYIVSSKDFAQVATRMALVRNISELRAEQIKQIECMTQELQDLKVTYEQKRVEVDSVAKLQRAQREKLLRDVSSAKAEVSKMSKQEQARLKAKQAQERQLTVAISELQKLTKGNTQGASFKGSTKGLKIPVVGGRVTRYMGNMAEISGPANARIITIYDGKVVDIKSNRITGKYDVYIAHGEYLSSYTNLQSVTVKTGSKVAKGDIIGVIGSSVDIITMESTNKIFFGIYSPSPTEVMKASSCFK